VKKVESEEEEDFAAGKRQKTGKGKVNKTDHVLS